MILGTTRNPFDRPAAASGSFQPKMPGTGFYSHFNPFIQVMERMPSAAGYRPPYPPTMGPTPLPVVPPPAPPVPVAPGGTKGFGAAGFGSTGGVRGGGGHMHVDPYSVMRSGMFPGINPSGSNIRDGVRNAGARVHRGFPFQTAPLPALPPPPPPVATTVAPGGTKGFGYFGDDFGAQSWRGRPRRRRSWISRAFVPETYAEVSTQPECETYPPNIDGLRKTVCNGRVVRVEDQYGNVRIPGQMPPGFAGW
jgi:hypothetical protein